MYKASNMQYIIKYNLLLLFRNILINYILDCDRQIYDIPPPEIQIYFRSLLCLCSKVLGHGILKLSDFHYFPDYIS